MKHQVTYEGDCDACPLVQTVILHLTSAKGLKIAPGQFRWKCMLCETPMIAFRLKPRAPKKLAVRA